MPGIQRTRLEGAKELDRVLARLPKKIGKRVFMKAGREGGKVIQGEALQNLGSADKKDIIVRKVRVQGTSLTMRIGPPRSKFQLMLKEFGTQPHRITTGGRRGAKKKLLVDTDAGLAFGTEINHPGQPARPFLRPAFDVKKGEALATVGKVLGTEIEKAAVKLAGSFAKSGLKRRKRRRRR